MKTPQRLTLLCALLLLPPPAATYRAQTAPGAPGGAAKTPDVNEAELKRLTLLADLQSLATESAELEEPLARALAKAEIADAAWRLDASWAKQLVREAFELTLPGEEEAKKRVAQPAADPARDAVRARVLQVAAHDPALAKELGLSGAGRLGQRESQLNYGALAGQALQQGDTAGAGRFIEQSIRIDPTQMDAGFSIVQLAARDRAAADRLIITYLETLRGVPLNSSTAARTYVMLGYLVFPSSTPAIEGVPRNVAPPGPAVMKAYVGFMIESLDRLEQSEPGSLQRLRPILLNVWPVLKQHAPELTGAFLQVEARSRRPGEDASLPGGSIEALNKEGYEKRLKAALDSDRPDTLTIYAAINKGDFGPARRMIDKLDSGSQKSQLLEAVNAGEALSLADKGDLTKAGQLARELTQAVSLMRVYPVIVGKCVALKDRTCAADSVYQAIRQLKEAGNSAPAAPAGVPASMLPTGREFDPVALSLCKLAKSVAPIDGELALNVLDEVVQAANRSEVDTTQGRTGLEMDVFKLLAAVDETRVYQAAGGLRQRLPRIVALATLGKRRADAFGETLKAVPRAAGRSASK